MAALLAIAMFAVFITADWLLSRRRAAVEVPTTDSVRSAEDFVPDAEPAPQPVFVAGYEMPERLHYHRGHTWARLVAPDTAVVGVDDFARHLVGRVERVKPPRVNVVDTVAAGDSFTAALTVALVEGQAPAEALRFACAAGAAATTKMVANNDLVWLCVFMGLLRAGRIACSVCQYWRLLTCRPWRCVIRGR